MRGRTRSRTCRATTIAFTASDCVASSKSAGYLPSIDQRVSSGSSIGAKALPSSSGNRCASRSRSCSFGGSTSRRISRGLERLLCSLVCPYVSAAGNHFRIRSGVLCELEVFVGPAQPSASDVRAIRRQGLALRVWRRARHQERLLLRRGGPDRQR